MHLFAEPMFCDNDWIERSLDFLREHIEWEKQGLISKAEQRGEWMQLVPMYETSTTGDYEWIEGHSCLSGLRE